MIVPTPEFDPMFAEDGIPLRTKMIQYIKREFGDLLGTHAGRIRTDEDLETLSTIYLKTNGETSRPAKAA
jgi:hypothetical protein